jgi:hypothetical protein
MKKTAFRGAKMVILPHRFPGLAAGGALKILRPIPSRALLLNEGTFEQNPGY